MVAVTIINLTNGKVTLTSKRLPNCNKSYDELKEVNLKGASVINRGLCSDGFFLFRDGDTWGLLGISLVISEYLYKLPNPESVLKFAYSDFSCFITSGYRSSKYTVFEVTTNSSQGVASYSGDVLIKPKCRFAKMISENVVAVQDEPHTLWYLYDLKSNRNIAEGLKDVSYVCDGVYSESDHGVVTSVNNIKTGCKLNARFFYLLGISNELMEYRDIVGGFGLITVADLSRHKNAIYDSKTDKVWCKRDHEMYIIDQKTGKSSRMPYVVAKSLGCPLV